MHFVSKSLTAQFSHTKPSVSLCFPQCPCVLRKPVSSTGVCCKIGDIWTLQFVNIQYTRKFTSTEAWLSRRPYSRLVAAVLHTEFSMQRELVCRHFVYTSLAKDQTFIHTGYATRLRLYIRHPQWDSSNSRINKVVRPAAYACHASWEHNGQVGNLPYQVSAR